MIFLGAPSNNLAVSGADNTAFSISSFVSCNESLIFDFTFPLIEIGYSN